MYFSPSVHSPFTRPAVCSLQLTLYASALDIVRLGPDEPPLTAVRLKEFYRNALKEFNKGGGYGSETAINFYSKAGVAHFVYRDGCKLNTWPFAANSASFVTVDMPPRGSATGRTWTKVVALTADQVSPTYNCQQKCHLQQG